MGKNNKNLNKINLAVKLIQERQSYIDKMEEENRNKMHLV